MAERRMFAKTIVLSDAFLDMPMSARCLYFTLGMFADDDGFVNAPKAIMRQCGASEDDMKILIARKFVIAFETGVIVIKHWRINNYLRNDRYVETKCLDEKSILSADDSGTYHICNDKSGIPNSGIPSIGKDSIDKDSKEKDNSKAEKKRQVEEFFDNIWKLYPKKKGKGQVSYNKKSTLYDLGYDTISTCINRYVEEFNNSHSDIQYMMYGSTFFNSGYVDYLDVNYYPNDSTAPTDTGSYDAYGNMRQ